MHLSVIVLVVSCIAAVAPAPTYDDTLWYEAVRPDKAMCKLCQCFAKNKKMEFVDEKFEIVKNFCKVLVVTECTPSVKRDIPASCQTIFEVPETTVLQVCTMLAEEESYTGFFRKSEFRKDIDTICANIQ